MNGGDYTLSFSLSPPFHTVPDLSLLNDQMIHLLAMQRLQHLFTEPVGEGGEGDKHPLEPNKLGLNGIKQPVPLAQPVKPVKAIPTAGEPIYIVVPNPHYCDSPQMYSIFHLIIFWLSVV